MKLQKFRLLLQDAKMTFLCALTLSLLLPVPASAFAFGRSVVYSDPPSQIGAFFTDKARDDRPPVGRLWKTEEEIRESWNSFQAKLEGPEFQTCDFHAACTAGNVNYWLEWNLWFQFNIDAAQTWNELVTCNGNDEETARIAYYKNKDFCGRDRGNGAKIREKLIRLHGNIRDFIDSTHTQFPNDFHEKPRIAALSRILPAHPLFAQIVLEYFSTLVRFHREDPTQYEFVYDKSWIDGDYNRHFKNRVEDILKADPQSGDSSYAHARAFINAHFIVGILPKENLAAITQWGLWSTASARLVELAAWQSVSRNTSNLITGLLQDPFVDHDDLQFSKLLFAQPGGTVTEFRSMAERYGFPTYRKRYCKTKPLSYDFCFAVDPSNPDETNYF